MEIVQIDPDQITAITDSLELVARVICLCFGALLHMQFAQIFKPYR